MVRLLLGVILTVPFTALVITERPLANYGSGMATATLRVTEEGNPDYAEHLRHCFTALFELYGPGRQFSWLVFARNCFTNLFSIGYFDVNVSANCILQGNSDQRYSVW